MLRRFGDLMTRRSDFFQDAFTKCARIRKFLDITYKVQSPTVDTKPKYPCSDIYPGKLTHAHNVFEVAELCRTQADILKPTLDRTRVASQITEISTKSSM